MDSLNLEQAAAFLHMHPMTLLRKAQSGEVIACKPAKRWVFLKVDLVEYLRSKCSQQASEGDNKESALCHSTKGKTQPSGGTKSDTEAKYYKKALGLPIR